MNIAEYRSPDGRLNYLHQAQGESFERICGYLRLSEFADVEFKPLPPEVVVPQELAKIDEAEAELRTKFQQAMNKLTERRANLLSLTHQS